MATDFIGQMIHLRDMTAPIAGVFQVRQIRSLILRQRIVPPGQATAVTSLLEITPNPYIETASPRLAAAFQGSNITIEIDDYNVKGISLNYTQRQLVDTGITYFVDAVLNADRTQIISGIECDFIAITCDTLCWKMILRRKPDQR